MGRTRLREQQVEDSDLVSEHELKASLLDSPLVQGIFPVSVASTSAGTGQITLEDPIVQTSMTASGDHLQVVGGTAAGVYEVTSIVDDYTVIVSPAPPTSSQEGQATLYHPPGSTRVGVNPATFGILNPGNLQELLEEIDQNLQGVLTELAHEDFYTLTHLNARNSFEEYSYTSGRRVAGSILWEDATKTKKIREYSYTYLGNTQLITESVEIQYDGAGVEKYRLTTTYTYNPDKTLHTLEVVKT